MQFALSTLQQSVISYLTPYPILSDHPAGERENAMKKLFLIPLIVFFVGHQSAWGAEIDNLTVSGPVPGDKISFQQIETGKLLVSVTDPEEQPRLGLGVNDFSIRNQHRKAQILNVEPLTTDKEVGLHIVMVVDNSQSMQLRKAVEPLLEAMESFYSIVRPIDTVTAVVYDAKQTMEVQGQALHAKVLTTHSAGELRAFLQEQMTEGITGETFLYDAMMVGLEQIRQWPSKSNKFMVVFTDGEDLNSAVKDEDVMAAAQGIPNFAAYCVDFMPAKTTDAFLKTFALEHNGHIWKAQSAAQLLPIFNSFSSTLLHRYIVSYRFFNPPAAALAFKSPQVTIEEVTTIDSAPLLNYVYFDVGQSELPQRYIRFESRTETDTFDETSLTRVMGKYRHLLNIIGFRLRKNPDAAINLVGCNSNTGNEYQRNDLSRSRAESVRAYLRYVWGIAPERMTVETRNLPDAPSTNRIVEGQAENQRVEIRSEHAAILDTVKSQYVEKVSTTQQIEVVPNITAEAGIADWQIVLRCGPHVMATFEGRGDPAPAYILPITADDLEIMSGVDRMTASMRLTDRDNNTLTLDDAAALPISFIRRREQMAMKQGHRVREKYALILFDYDSAAIKARNQIIVDRIVQRLRAVPEAAVDIVGHTDNIGKEDYNLRLSEKRAHAVQQQFLHIGDNFAGEMSAAGAGPHSPLYDNLMPEGRALNRTVTVALEYERR